MKTISIKSPISHALLQNHLQMRHSDSNTNPNINNVNQVPISQPVQTNSIPANISTPQTTAINDQVNPQTERCSGCGILLEKGRKEHICPGVNKVSVFPQNAALHRQGLYPRFLNRWFGLHIPNRSNKEAVAQL